MAFNRAQNNNANTDVNKPLAYANVNITTKNGKQKVGAIPIASLKEIHKSILAHRDQAENMKFTVELVFIETTELELDLGVATPAKSVAKKPANRTPAKA
ncbi:hypothetical protein BAE46_00895 [Glaciecola punicea]|jgi:hypothetical protein|uniref:hypothetical protein n=1 Tax=Glaciecola punicea TaxID=56804 RepID=UPI0008724C8B|nr:hypothetical protein [Glaciecola punicea]OFA33299.1 hypothetical protein BAE46_00895 [Glaciecola punicea]